MTDTQARKPAGVPVGGQFAAVERTDAAITLGVAGPRDILVSELEPGDVIIGKTGNRIAVLHVYSSADDVLPGNFVAETEFGTLYLPGHFTVTVDNNSDFHTVVNNGELIDHNTLDVVLKTARDNGQISGRIYTRDSIESAIDTELDLISDGASSFEEDEAEAILNAVSYHAGDWDRGTFLDEAYTQIRFQPGWAGIGNHESYESELNVMDNLVRDAMISVMGNRASQL